jgi:hypothetical protein
VSAPTRRIPGPAAGAGPLYSIGGVTNPSVTNGGGVMWGLLFRAVLAALRGASVTGVRVATLGRVAFVGLIRNRPLAQLTQQEIRNAFAQVGLREAHNAHFVSRLVSRGPQFGIHTLDDLARALNNGVARAGSQPGTTEIVFPGGRAAAVLNSAGELVTFLPL